MSAPDDTATPSAPAEDLSIRGAPKPVKRFNRKMLGVMLGGAALLVFSSFGMALGNSSSGTRAPAEELYSTTNNTTAEGLANLPASYAEIEQKPPELGPALPGDLGAAILAAQQDGRLPPADPLAHAPDPDLADQEAALIANRHRSLFFDISGSGRASVQTNPTAVVASQFAEPVDPFDVLNTLVGDSIPTAVSDQDRKRAFTEEQALGSIYNPYELESPISPWQLMAGSVIPATLLTAINSDLPGQVVGQVTEPVYDTVTGDTLLIPQGTRIIGRYDSAVAFGQSRALIVWRRLIMPDGSSIRIDNLPAVDGRGNAGLRDRVNNHSIRLFTAAALSSLISIGAEVASNDDDERIARALREAAQDGVNTAGQAIVNRQLSVQPTLTIRPGWRVRILVHQDIILKPYGD